MANTTRKFGTTKSTSSKGLASFMSSELLRFLYDQLPLFIIPEVIVAFITGFVLYTSARSEVIYLWLGYLLLFSTTSRALLYYYHNKKIDALSEQEWSQLHQLTTALSALFWGFLGGYFYTGVNMYTDQFLIFILLGVTTTSITLYSANRNTFALFLLIAFTPLLVRLFLNGGISKYLALCGVVYMGLMLLMSDSQMRLLKKSVLLQFENQDLDSINQTLEKNISFHESHDPLTQLPNRALLRDRIEHDIAIASRFKSYLGVMLIDLDNFKDIDDMLGFQRGNTVLQVVANRLKSCVRSSDTVARYGGDEFIILFISKNKEEMNDLCRDILRLIALPIGFEGKNFHITASIGLSIYPDDGTDGASLVRNADFAMFLSKKNGRNTYHIYSNIVHTTVKRQHEIQQQLLNLSDQTEFSLMYQPIVRVDTMQIVAAEALLRWKNPVLGLVSPEEFIAIAEDLGTFVSISEWVMRQACTQNKRWQAAGAEAIKIAINISSVQLRRGNLIKLINKILREINLAPSQLVLELTETSLLDNSKAVISSLLEIRSLGIDISIDDFGSGYSTFRYITEFPASRIKIDKSLVLLSATNKKNFAIIQAIVTMAHQLDLKVIAEGVENAEQFEMIKATGCDEIQGYYFSKPLEANDFLALLMHTSIKVKGKN